MTEAAAQADEPLPIDIDYAKFLEWLVDRQRIPRNWHTLLKSARTLARTALAQTPHAVQEGLSIPELSPHQNLPYYSVCDILTSLTSADAPPEWGSQEKDLLGRFKSPVHRAWSDAVTAFEKKYVYLADAAQQLVRNADVEAPAIKATITRLNGEVADSVRREGPAIRAAADAKQRFEEACREFDLKDGDTADFEAQLKEEVERRVPDVLAVAVRLVQEEAFCSAVAYYDEFAQYVAGADADELCSTVKEVMEGDVAELTRKVGVESKEDEIDWGEESVNIPAPLVEETGGGEIDWGIEIDASGTTGETKEDTTEKPTDANATPAEGGIDWGDGDQTGGIDWNEGAGMSEATTTGADAGDANGRLTLTDPKARERYLNDLVELDAFLAQRSAELSRSGGSEVGLVMQQATGTPVSIKRVDADRVRGMHGAVRKAIEAINSEGTRRILTLQSNKKRLERAARGVLERKHVAERMAGAIDILRQRRARAGAELGVEGPRLEELGKVTRDVKMRTEQALSGLYRGRSVNILGEINNVFPPM